MAGTADPPRDAASSQRNQRSSPVWPEMLAGMALVHGRALDSLAAPALMVRLPAGEVAAANAAAAELLAIPVARMLGRLTTDVAHFVDQPAVTSAFRELASGSIDAYRARRCLIRPDGSRQELLTWSRAVDLDGARAAVVLAMPAALPAQHAQPLVWVEPMVVGTTDAQWRVVSVSAEVSDLLGGTRADFLGRPALGAAHPDDVGELLRVIAGFRAGEMVLRDVRVRHEEGSWVHVHLCLTPLSDERPPPLGFVMLPHQPELHVGSDDRAGDLETHLRNIVAELEAAGMIEGIAQMPSATDFPAINRLSTRQWQILIRLLRGERVPTIASHLYLSPGTVRNHLAAIYRLFGVHSQASLLALLRRR